MKKGRTNTGIGNDARWETVGAELGQLLQEFRSTYLVYAVVDSVDEDARTIDAVINDDHVIGGISMDVVANGNNGVFIVPEVGSWVIIGFAEGIAERPIIVKTTKVSKIIITTRNPEDEQEMVTITMDGKALFVENKDSSCLIEENSISLSSPSIEFNGGELGGLVIVGELKTALNKINGFIDTFKQILGGAPIPEPGNGSPSALQTALNTALGSKQLDDYSKIENTHITQ